MENNIQQAQRLLMNEIHKALDLLDANVVHFGSDIAPNYYDKPVEQCLDIPIAQVREYVRSIKNSYRASLEAQAKPDEPIQGNGIMTEEQRKALKIGVGDFK